jgi:replicative DNA helicase
MAQDINPEFDNHADPIAEQNILGAMLKSKDAVVDVFDVIKNSQVFYQSKNQTVFEAMQNLSARGIEVDVTTVKNHLDQAGKLEAIGGVSYLIELIESTPLTSSAAHYAQIVRGLRLRRKIIEAGDRIKALGQKKDGTSPNQLFDQAQSLIFDASEANSAEEFSRIDVLMENVNLYLEQIRLRGGVAGISSPFVDLNKSVRGLKPGQLIIIGGRPSMGKSTLLLDFARSAAFRQDVPTALFSLEDEPMLLSLKILSAESSIPKYSLEQASLDEKNTAALLKTQQNLAHKPLFIDGSSHLSLLEIHTKSRRINQKLLQEGKKLELILIDYLQLVRTGDNHESRQQEVATISRSLKALAKELQIPIVAAAQLSRAAEEHGNRPPRMSELRESGQIEQDADVILLIHRKTDENNAYDSTTELIVEKNRAGERGNKITLNFNGILSRFEDAY